MAFLGQPLRNVAQQMGNLLPAGSTQAVPQVMPAAPQQAVLPAQVSPNYQPNAVTTPAPNMSQVAAPVAPLPAQTARPVVTPQMAEQQGFNQGFNNVRGLVTQQQQGPAVLPAVAQQVRNNMQRHNQIKREHMRRPVPQMMPGIGMAQASLTPEQVQANALAEQKGMNQGFAYARLPN